MRAIDHLRILAVANWDWSSTPAPWAATRIEALRATGAEVDLLAEDCIGDRRGFARLWRALDDRLERGGYHVVAPLYGSFLGLLCSVQRRVPCALSLAGSDLNGSFEADGRRVFSSLFSTGLSQLGAMLSRGVSVRNRHMRDQLWWPPARRHAEVIGSGVDLSRFVPAPRDEARRRRKLPTSVQRIAFFARDAETKPGKRLELARAAVAQIPGARLDVVSDLPIEEMPAAYAAANALIVTAVAEGSPNCVKEALACAIPVISVETGDVAEVIGGLTNCAVVDATPAALATALRRALSDGRGCPDGPARMAERYSVAAMATRFVRFYEKVAGVRTTTRK